MAAKTMNLWPRHEVLHLVTPSLSQSGRNLSNAVIIEVSRQLYKVQTPDGLISFEQWLIIAKEHLKWNDWCIRLFWDMLHASIWYQLSDDSSRVSIEDFVDIGRLVIFLSLHQITTNNRPSSPTKLYDSYWPSPDKEDDSTLPSSEYASPNTSPSSPRKKQVSPRPSSPKPRSPLLQVKHTRSSTYHVHSLKDKMLLMLRLLSGIETGFMDVESMALGTRSNSMDEIDMVSPRQNACYGSMEITLSQRSMDALGLVMGAGLSKTVEVNFGAIFPYWENPKGESASADNDQFDFDFDLPTSPRFAGFPQPNSVSSVSSGRVREMVTTGEPSSGASPIPTSPSKIAKAKGVGFGADNDDGDSMNHSVLACFSCSDFAEWVDSHLEINETRYPIISHKSMGVAPTATGSPRYDEEWVHSGGISPPKPSAFKGDLDFGGAEDPSSCVPTCTYVSSGDVVGWEPQVVFRRQSVLMHIVTPGLVPASTGSGTETTPRADGTTSGGLFGLSNLSIGTMNQDGRGETEAMVMSPPQGDEDNEAGVSYEEGGEDGHKQHMQRKYTKQESECLDEIPEGALVNRDLPPLYVQSCLGTNLYLLGSYSSAAVTSCIGCEIVIGAVHGVVRLVGCERVRFTVACRKLVIVNCSDCIINVACVKPSVLIGENKALSIGPHNVNYRLLKSHLMTAGLKGLTMPAKYGTNSNVSGSNNWHLFYDVGTLLETPLTANSPTGYAVDAAVSRNQPAPPTPPDAVVRFLPPFSFLFVTVPLASEARGFEVGNPIEIPPAYYRALLNRRKKLTSLQRSVIDFAAGTSHDPSSLQSTLSHRFLEWLVKNGKAQQVMDLIRIDETSKQGSK